MTFPPRLAAASLASLLLSGTACALAQDSSELPPLPETPRGDHVDVYHGAEVADPYRWLEDAASPEAEAWIRAQDARTRAVLEAQNWEATRARIAELTNIERTGLFQDSDAGVFFARIPSSFAEATYHVRDRATGAERELLAPPYRVEPADGERVFFARAYPDEAGGRLAYLVSRDNAPWLEVRVLDVETGDLASEVLEGVNRSGAGLAWTPDGDAFFYVAFAEGEPDAAGNPRAVRPEVRRHVVGTPQSEDVVIHAFADGEGLPSPKVSDDGRWLVLEMVDPEDNSAIAIRMFDLENPDAPVVDPFADRPGLYSFLDVAGGDAFFYTTHEAPNGRIVKATPASDGGFDVAEVVPEREDAVDANLFFGQGKLGLYGGRLVVTYARGGAQLLRIFDLDGALAHEADVGVGALFGAMAGDPDRAEFIVPYATAVSPGRASVVDARTGEVRTLVEPDLPFDPDAFVIERVSFESEPGVRVPMYVVRREDVELDGNNLAFMYAYGAWGWVAQLWYQPHVMHLLENGGIYAQPGVRGGGEFGADWEAAGRGRDKPNTIRDYIAAAEFLIAEGYTSPELMVFNGGSASGMLPAIAAAERPDLAAGAVIDIPVLDMLRFTAFDNGDQWVGAFGSPDDPEDYAVLKSYSPYHALLEAEDGTCLPPTLVMAGDQDRTATPIHAYKYAAAAQAAQTCDAPVLLDVMEGAGHNFGGDAAQTIVSRTDQAVFLQMIEARAAAD